MEILGISEMDEKIRNLLKIMKSESTLIIYNYIIINKLVTPATMRKKLKMPKASVFRSIDLMISSEIIEKQLLEFAIDGSKQGYEIVQNFEEINKSIVTSKWFSAGGELVEKWKAEVVYLADSLNRAAKNLLVTNFKASQIEMFSIFDLDISAELLDEFFVFIKKLIARRKLETGVITSPVSLNVSICGDILKYIPKDLVSSSQSLHLVNSDSVRISRDDNSSERSDTH